MHTGKWIFALLCTAGAASALAASPVERGERFFNSVHGRDWSCASCHTGNPLQPGKHARTGKPIAPLAPAANPERFTDAAKVDKWFRRNCNDVLGRDCSAEERSDIRQFLMSLGKGR
jgi:mono/diheme cytochrome c family protein